MVTPKELLDKEINKYNVDCNKYVYHYTKLNVGFENILHTGELRMSPFCKVNDPTESKKRNFGISYSISDFIPEEERIGLSIEEVTKKLNHAFIQSGCSSEKISLETNKLFMHDSKLICFSCDDSQLLNEKYSDKIYYRGFCKPRMWAQYADNHRGFCFVFDKDELDTQISNRLIGKGKLFKDHVQYTNRTDIYRYIKHLKYSQFKDIGLKEYLINYHLKKFEKEIFFRKSLDWRDEYEFRWVFISEDDAEYVYFPFENSLKEIYVGIDFPEVYNDLLLKLNGKYNAKIYKIGIHEGALVIDEIRP